MGQYNEYVQELKPIREELGVLLKEDLFPATLAGERVAPDS